MMAKDILQSKRLTVLHGADSCSLRLFSGVEPAALAMLVAARLGLEVGHFYLTLEHDDSELIPLSAALPDGLVLTAHLRSSSSLRPRAASGLASPPRASPARAASPARSPRGGGQLHDASTSSTDMGQSLLDAMNDAGLPRSPLAEEVTVQLARQCTELHAVRQAQDHLSLINAQAAEESARTLDRYSRLSTDLANERTLLAWIRTGLAAMRTVFSFYGLKSIKIQELDMTWVCQIAMALTVIVAGVSGWARYKQIKIASYQLVPPENFGRISIRWFTILVMFTSVAVALAVVAKGVVNIMDDFVPAHRDALLPAVSDHILAAAARSLSSDRAS
eukprot:TRINITY_DN94516_c0_g1_i1.p1 TRINITY_DN94516_c0_g1~~TRINITY_DN94516_c0_g1_i1.p1  ORF type:complete len:334 (-),score=69.35 TRINITY_DN94516_c0_g1_i1:477-1478(-)